MIKKNTSNEKHILVLTQYPIVDQLRQEIHANLGEHIRFLVVSTLAANGYAQLLSNLRKERYEQLYIFIADKTALPLTPVLKILSLTVPANERYLLMPQTAPLQFSVLDCFLGGASIVAALLQGGLAIMRIGTRAGVLNYSERLRLSETNALNGATDIAYIKTNLWLGVQAGGALTHTWGVIRGFLGAGARVRYLSADTRNMVETEFEHILVEPRKPYIIPRELNHFLYHQTFFKSAHRNIEQFSGTIYQRLSIGNFVGVELSRHYKCPLIIEYNGSESWLARNWGTPFAFPGMVSLIESVSLKHAHVIATVSEPLRHELMARGVAENRIVVHPNGVDPSDFDPARFSADQISKIRDELGVPEDGILISFVGTFGPWHGAELLAQAATMLIENKSHKESDKIYFLFIGDGVRRAEVETFTSERIKEGRVFLAGLISPEEIPGYLVASDILVSPTVQNPDKSQFFGSPTKLFEYMAAGKPIIASKIGQIEEVMAGSYEAKDLGQVSSNDPSASTDKLGVLVSPGDLKELCEAIIFLSKHASLRRSWGQFARQRVLERYTWGHHVSAIANKLDEVIRFENNRKTTVLINGLHSKSGGGVTYLKNLLPYFSANEKLDIHLCINQRQLSLFEPYINDVTLHVVDFENSLWRSLLSEQITIPKLALKINADVVFSPANYGPLFVRRSVILLRNALSVAFVERRASKILYWSMLYAGTLSSVFRARKVICVSKYAKKTAVGSTIGASPDKFQTIPHGISSEFSVDSELDRKPNTLLCVSDIYIQKNLHTFFESLPKLREKYPDLKVRVAGAPVDKGYMAALKKRLSELKMNDHVSFLGSLDVQELKKEYLSATMFVFPSTVETFGNPLVEAMACGCPIATSNKAAMPEVASDAVAYFDPHNAEDIARVIIDLLESNDKREELSQRAVERAKMFSWEETARKTADVLIEAARK